MRPKRSEDWRSYSLRFVKGGKSLETGKIYSILISYASNRYTSVESNISTISFGTKPPCDTSLISDSVSGLSNLTTTCCWAPWSLYHAVSALPSLKCFLPYSLVFF